MEILDSRAAVYVQLYLISIVGNHEKGGAVLLRESEYLLKAATIYNTQLANGRVISLSRNQLWRYLSICKNTDLQRSIFIPVFYPSHLNEEHLLTRQKANALTGEHIRLPSHIRIIGTEAFAGRRKIKSVELPSRLLIIRPGAFETCQVLAEIKLPPNVHELGRRAFAGCSHLKAAYLSTRITSIPRDAFREDRMLTKVLFPPNSQLVSIEQGAFYECLALNDILLPPGLKSINNRAFYRCKELKTIRFPKGLISIGAEAFYFTKIESLELPDTLEYLGDSAFFKCNCLTEVRLPTSIKHIGKWVFHGCNRLQVLEIRHDPEFIGEWIINRAARIRCYRGSKVDEYCQSSGFTVEYIEKETNT